MSLQKQGRSLTLTQKDLGGMGYLSYIPFLNAYYNDASHLINAGFHGLDAADVLVSSMNHMQMF